jgi:hypothetical protein
MKHSALLQRVFDDCFDVLHSLSESKDFSDYLSVRTHEYEELEIMNARTRESIVIRFTTQKVSK